MVLGAQCSRILPSKYNAKDMIRICDISAGVEAAANVAERRGKAQHPVDVARRGALTGDLSGFDA